MNDRLNETLEAVVRELKEIRIALTKINASMEGVMCALGNTDACDDDDDDRLL